MKTLIYSVETYYFVLLLVFFISVVNFYVCWRIHRINAKYKKRMKKLNDVGEADRFKIIYGCTNDNRK